MEESQVSIAQQSDAESALSTLMLGLASDSYTRWLMPESSTYIKNFAYWASPSFKSALAHGTVYTIDNFAGVMVLLGPGVKPDMRGFEASLQGLFRSDRTADIVEVSQQLAERRPAEPHWYLPMIAVDPACQREGLGSLLLEQVCARADTEGLPVYGECTGKDKVRLYQRFGCEVMGGEIQVGDSPVMIPVYRPARPIVPSTHPPS